MSFTAMDRGLAPELLHETAYETIGRLMGPEGEVDRSGHAAINLSTVPGNQGLDTGHVPSGTVPPNSSFIRQMDVVWSTPAEIVGSSDSDQPTAFLLTAFSAIPVADSVRGYFDARGEAAPYIGYIMASWSAIQERAINRPPVFDFPPHNMRTVAFETEVTRLAGILEGMKHVCIIDQFVESGACIRYASNVLEAVGVSTVTAVRGRWYEQADHAEINVQGLTSKHAAFMHQTGAQL